MAWCAAPRAEQTSKPAAYTAGPGHQGAAAAAAGAWLGRMNDRLGELTGGGVAPFEIAIDINDDGGGSGGGGGGNGGGARATGGTFMEGFFDKVNAVKKDIDAVKKVCALKTQWCTVRPQRGLSPSLHQRLPCGNQSPCYVLYKIGCEAGITKIVPCCRAVLRGAVATRKSRERSPFVWYFCLRRKKTVARTRIFRVP